MLSWILGEIALRELVARLPLDINAVFAYAVMAILIGLIWWDRRNERELSPPYRPAEAEKQTPETPQAQEK